MTDQHFTPGARLRVDLVNGDVHWIILDGLFANCFTGTALANYDDDEEGPGDDEWTATDPAEVVFRLYPMNSILYCEQYGESGA